MNQQLYDALADKLEEIHTDVRDIREHVTGARIRLDRLERFRSTFISVVIWIAGVAGTIIGGLAIAVFTGKWNPPWG